MKIHLRTAGLAAIACVGLAAISTGQEPAAPRPRSVLFYLVDTCRQDRLGFDGYARPTTPFLDWLALRSVVFEACYSQAAWTKPSMASMLSSQYPSTTGVYRMDHRLADDVVTWPEVLQANGLYTAGFSANIVMGNSLSNFAQGFDYFVESTVINGADPIRFASGSAKKLNAHVFGWLERTEHWPTLLYLHSVDPHEEYEPEQRYLERFADPERHVRYREEWKALLESRPPIPGLYVTQDNFDRTRIDSASFIGHGSDLYDADVLANDFEMQRLWDELQKDGWGEDFIFVFTSDHGEEFFEHGGTCHGYSLYDEMIRVPLLIYAPGLLPAGKRIATPVRSLDIYPTLGELLGFAVPDGLQGESLVPLIRDGESGEGRPIISEHREDPILRRIGHGSGVMVSLRRGRWKLIVNQVPAQLIERPRLELYDMDADPGERTNVADRHPDVVQRLEAEVARFVATSASHAAEPDGAPLDPEVLEQLRKLGYVGEDGLAPDLWEAIETGDARRIRACLKAGADVDRRDEVLGISPLSLAATVGDLELARLLLAHDASINAKNKDGSIPLHGAALFGWVDMLQLLLAAGANPAAKNFAGDTVLDATRAPWDLTVFIASLFELELDRDEVEAGRAKCVELLSDDG